MARHDGPWTHDALAADLLDARHLAGEIALERLATWNGGQLDVASLRLSWSHPRPTGYEVKVTRADLLSDLRERKWKRYLPVTARLYFAVPKGLCDPAAIPEECGLLVRGPKSWRTVRKAPERELEERLFRGFVMAILFPALPRLVAAERRGLPRGACRGVGTRAEAAAHRKLTPP